jgi:hypothetical protein
VAAPVFGIDGHIAAAIELHSTDVSRNIATWQPALLVAAGTLSRDLARHLRSRQTDRWHHAEGILADLEAAGA